MYSPLSKNERQRLEALRSYEILDSEAETNYDDLVHLAAQICQVPIALISLVDADRQWFKARVGLGATETHRNLAFCAHAIMNPGEVMVVEDASKDPRFAENPLVTSAPNIRFYAGAPLVSPDGLALGTLCVIDQESRELSADQRKALEVLSQSAVSLMELRRANRIQRQTIVDLQASQAAAEKARDQATEATRAKSEFLATMSHEIRTPMNGVLGFTELLLESPLNEEQRKFTNTIKLSGEALLTIINDILDYSKIESGKLTLEQLPFDLAENIEEVVALMSARANEKNLELRVNYAPDVPRRLVADPTRVRQIVLNLVGNAVKFSPRGRVTVDVSTTEQAGRRFVRVAVIDTGIGIPQDKQAQLFQKFTQVDSTTTRRFGGSGLGLAICRQLADLMGGGTGLVSELGQGSTFWFTIPLVEAPAAGPAANSRPAIAAPIRASAQPVPGQLNLRVLVAEDNTVNQMFALALLKKLGCPAELASNGLAALQLFQTKPFDLILMDCQMPEMDGFEATAAIRQIERQRSGSAGRIPIVALTANAMKEDLDRCLVAGMDACLTKPLRVQELKKTLALWSPVTPGDPAGTPPQRAASN